MRFLCHIVLTLALICWLPMPAQALTWTKQASNTTSQLYRAIWSGTQFVAVGWEGTIVTSPDGETWTVQTSNSGATTSLNDVVWSGSQFVAVGGPQLSDTGAGVIVTSTDGETWTPRTSNAAHALMSVIWSGAQYVAVGQSGTIVTSPDGITWTARTYNVAGTTHLNEVIWSGTQFVAVGRAETGTEWGTEIIVTSPDGITWTPRAYDSMLPLTSVVWSGTQFVAGGGTPGTSGSVIVTSPDGITWTKQADEALGCQILSILWNGSLFVAVGSPEIIVTSLDGVTWSRRAYDAGSGLSSVAWSGTEFAAVGYGRWVTGELLLSSPDGVTWTEDVSDAGETIVLNSVIWGGTQFIAVGNSGIILSGVGAESTRPIDGSTAGFLCSSDDLDPINTFTGELFCRESTDLDLGGPMPLYFQRYYASYLRRSFIVGDLGSNWRHNFDARLNWSNNTITYITQDGRVTDFLQDLGTGDWNQLTNTDTPYQLSAEAGRDATLYDPEDDRIYTFDYTTGGVILGKLVRIEDGRGNVHTVTYDLATGQVETVSDGLGRTLTFTYNDDAIPKISAVSDGTRSVSFQYTDPIDTEYLTLVTDALSGVTEYSYKDTSADADHALMTSTTRPLGNVPYSQTFFDTSAAASGRVATQTDADGNTFSFDYSGLETTLTDPLGNTRAHTHTATGEFSSRQDQAGLSFTMGSDSTGRRNSLTDRLGHTTTIDHNMPSGNISAVTNPDGTTSTFGYTARLVGGLTLYDVTSITHADGATESLSYDALGNATSHTDQIGNTTAATYNANGQPLTTTNVAGATTTNTYNADGTLATTTDPAGNTTTFGYDSLKRLNLITFADGTTRSFTYNNHDQLLTRTDGNGNTTTLTYNANGNLTSTTDPLGNTTAFEYDGNDRLLSVTDPLGNTASITYNQLGKVKTITDKNGNVTTMGYNTLGRLISITDPLGNVDTITYDAEFIIASSTNPLGNTTTFTSDSMGRITSTTSPLGNVSNVTYDGMGRITAVENARGQTTTHSYDARGLLSSITLPGSITASYTRNNLGLIIDISDPTGNNWQRAYDSQGRLTSTTDPLGNVISYQYNNRNRVSKISLPTGTLDFSYDGVGNITRKLYSDATDLNYTYDVMNRLIGADGITLGYDANGRITSSNGLTVTRDAGGRIADITLATGKVITYTYDGRDLLTQVADWLGGTTTFTYDAAGRLTGIARPNGVVTHYSYDSEDRLTGITEGSVSNITLTLDGIGQITAATRNVPLEPNFTDSTKDFSYDAASQISAYTYDGMGCLTNDGTRTYTWDLASRMTGYTEDANTVTFTYDALGQRLSRTEGGTTRSYVWNYALGLPSVSVVRDGGDDLCYYVYTPGGRLLYSIKAADNNRCDYHFDEMGNTLFLTDSAGAIAGSYAHSPYGEILSSTGGLDNPFTWQGEYGVMDEGNGLYYVRTRYYDANTSRFISRDLNEAIGPKNVNPYQYALDNPLRFVDVTGKDSVEDAELRNLKAAFDVAKADLKAADAALNAAIARWKARDRGYRSLWTPFRTLPAPYAAFSPYVTSMAALCPPGTIVPRIRLSVARKALRDALDAWQAALDAYENAHEAYHLHLQRILDRAKEKVKKAKNDLDLKVAITELNQAEKRLEEKNVEAHELKGIQHGAEEKSSEAATYVGRK
ncbi:MAG: hypothetical protein AMJ75_00055 [Phycisphaerae bacterium SM1_79]|nr:MAG: hypothetical protein AMJ75_00055 [Phycisphaerae bacterium SM1_79]